MGPDPKHSGGPRLPLTPAGSAGYRDADLRSWRDAGEDGESADGEDEVHAGAERSGGCPEPSRSSAGGGSRGSLTSPWSATATATSTATATCTCSDRDLARGLHPQARGRWELSECPPIRTMGERLS